MEEKAERSVVVTAAGLKSPLDKPLRELTEDDISQVTREDCRRFLKEKGMRRPSWNKSQAIQQVVSLKALLEIKPEDENDDDAVDDPGPFSSKRQKKYSDPSPAPPPPSRPPQHPFQFTSAAPDPLPRPAPPLPQPNDKNTEESPSGMRDPPATVEIACVSPRVDSKPDAAAAVVGQMTVFYGGKVNVFEGVPAEKALLIMQIAARQDFCKGPSLDGVVDLNRQIQLSQSSPFQAVISHRSLPASLQLAHDAGGMPVIRFPPCVREGVEWKNSREFIHEGSGYRKASLQRYLEKRKDRRTFKCRKNMDGLYSASTDLYMNQKFKFQNSNALECQKKTNSPPHLNPPSTPTRSNNIEDHTQSIRFSFDLNYEDVQEI